MIPIGMFRPGPLGTQCGHEAPSLTALNIFAESAGNAWRQWTRRRFSG
jgi:hypothetical protein